MNPPQAVTERYVNNLIRNGTNKEFTILLLRRQTHIIDVVSVGQYYIVDVGGGDYPTKSAVGVTISQAVRRALEKHGVTFR